jgi:hypothetical protein
MAKERGWHCMFTNSCIFEPMSDPVRIPGTSLVACGPHARQMEESRFNGGRDGDGGMMALGQRIALQGGVRRKPR